jgi:hypothetical protein
MSLQFLGKRKAGCNRCGGKGLVFESRMTYKLYSPFGIREFTKGRSYEFEGEELVFWSGAGYTISGVKFKYFKQL